MKTEILSHPLPSSVSGSPVGCREGGVMGFQINARRGETTVEELAPLMLRYMLAVNAAARAKKIKSK